MVISLAFVPFFIMMIGQSISLWTLPLHKFGLPDAVDSVPAHRWQHLLQH